MDQNSKTISGIPNPPIDPAEINDKLQNMLRLGTQPSVPALNTFARLQQRRAARMADVATALGQAYGQDDPRVVAAQNAVRSVTALKTRIETYDLRLKKWPKPRPNEWLVFGTVTNFQGQPARGLTVRVFDRDRKYDDLLGETETDTHGDFSVIYHERDFKETGEQLPDLYVMVSDPNGNQLYSSRDNIRFEAGKSEYFAIVLSEAARAAKSETTINSSSTTRISRKKS